MSADAVYTSLQSGLPLAWSGDGTPTPIDLSRKMPELVLKRGIDFVLSLVALLAFAPLFVIVAMAIKLTSRGPVLFRQMRPGGQGVPFAMYKFRTMHVDRADPTGITQTVPHDPRMTPIGSFLRRTSIDELPQLANVLMGQMSLVGPRPHPAGMMAAGDDYRVLVPYYALRYAMKPGMSGWAQAHGYRGPTDDAVRSTARIDHDIAYVQNFSILLDFRIIFLTVWREFMVGTGL